MHKIRKIKIQLKERKKKQDKSSLLAKFAKLRPPERWPDVSRFSVLSVSLPVNYRSCYLESGASAE